MTEPVIESFHPANSSLDGVGSNLPPSPEGVAFALGGLVLMAILPIVIYAFRSVSELKEKNKVCNLFLPKIWSLARIQNLLGMIN